MGRQCGWKTELHTEWKRAVRCVCAGNKLFFSSKDSHSVTQSLYFRKWKHRFLLVGSWHSLFFKFLRFPPISPLSHVRLLTSRSFHSSFFPLSNLFFVLFKVFPDCTQSCQGRPPIWNRKRLSNHRWRVLQQPAPGTGKSNPGQNEWKHFWKNHKSLKNS